MKGREEIGQFAEEEGKDSMTRTQDVDDDNKRRTRKPGGGRQDEEYGERG